jgi:alkyl hydroperoxide reductase subunit AhpC
MESAGHASFKQTIEMSLKMALKWNMIQDSHQNITTNLSMSL